MANANKKNLDLDYDIHYSEDDLKQLANLQEKMLALINTKSNWETTLPNVSTHDAFAKIKERQTAPQESSKNVLGIRESSTVAYSPLLLRSLAQSKEPARKSSRQLIPVQQALLEKYAEQWKDKAGADYPYVRLDDNQKVEFAHLTEGLNKEEMSQFIVIDPTDHKMYNKPEKEAEKPVPVKADIASKMKIWEPPETKIASQSFRMRPAVALEH